jgi:acetyl esterase/lipase
MANDQEGFLAQLRAPLVYRTAGMDAVTARRGIAYLGDAGPLMDVYAPPDLTPQPPLPGGRGGAAAAAGERRPVVFFIHGGPLPPGFPLPPTEWGLYRGYGALAAASGWIGVTFAHRFSGFDQLDQASADIAAAVAYVRDHAAELGADPDRVCLWAFSGGGLFLAEALRAPDPSVRCLVAYYPLLDARPMAAAPGVGERLDAEALRRHSALAALEDAEAITTPLLVARAGQDSPSLRAQADAFVSAALAKNAPLDLLNHPTGHHTFDAQDDNARTHAIISHTLAFIREHLGD